MKLLADAALVGFPNAGKSTLISAVSAARPKVADYPFTTLEPHLGVVEIDDRQFVMADVPGLIEGAAEGRGLGHEFLRHVERARALVVLLDPMQERPPEQQLEVLLSELERYSVDLSRRPRVIALNKADALDPDEAKRLAGKLPSSLHVISAAARQGLAKLLHAIADAVEEARREAPERVGYQLHRPRRRLHRPPRGCNLGRGGKGRDAGGLLRRPDPARRGRSGGGTSGAARSG